MNDVGIDFLVANLKRVLNILGVEKLLEHLFKVLYYFKFKKYEIFIGAA
jgi:hypothetical protein